jgi:hypothetical protein
LNIACDQDIEFRPVATFRDARYSLLSNVVALSFLFRQRSGAGASAKQWCNHLIIRISSVSSYAAAGTMFAIVVTMMALQ